jgi:hypothetical protein
LTSFDEASAAGPIGTIWSSSPWLTFAPGLFAP